MRMDTVLLRVHKPSDREVARLRPMFYWGRDRHLLRRMVKAHWAEYRCFVCSSGFTSPSAAYLDHDHETLVIRGLLCLNCNVAIGHLRDDARLASRLAAYLAGDYRTQRQAA